MEVPKNPPQQARRRRASCWKEISMKTGRRIQRDSTGACWEQTPSTALVLPLPQLMFIALERLSHTLFRLPSETQSGLPAECKPHQSTTFATTALCPCCQESCPALGQLEPPGWSAGAAALEWPCPAPRRPSKSKLPGAERRAELRAAFASPPVSTVPHGCTSGFMAAQQMPKLQLLSRTHPTLLHVLSHHGKCPVVS